MVLLQELPSWVGWFFGAVAVCGAISDLLKDKIYNWLTIPSFIIGVIVILVFSRSYILQSLYGILLATVFFVPLFFLGIMGAGDAKLVMALSTVLGFHGTFEMIYGAMLVGAAGALVILIRKRRVKIFIREVKKFFSTILINEMAIEFPNLDRNTKAPFGIAICMGYFYVFSGLA